MFDKFKAGLLMLMLVASVILGAAAAGTGPYTLTVVTKDSKTWSEITVDKVTITNKDTGVLVREASNEKSPSFSLPVGVYKVVTEKKAYSTDTQYVSMYDGNQKIEALLVAQPTSGGSTGSTGGTGSTSGTTSSTNTVYVKDVDFNDEVAPGDTVDFDINVKNGAGYDAENVQVTVTIMNVDDGDDIDVDSDTFDLDNKDDKDVTVSLTIPTDADDKKYDVEFKVEWEDAAGKDLQSVKTDSISVERADHDVRITNIQLDSDTTQAGANGQIAVSVQNVGSNDESVRFQVKSDQLGINAMSPQFNLKEDKESTQQVPFTVSSTAKPGKYFVYVTAFYGSKQVQDFVTLEVKAPGTATSTPSGPVTVTPVTVTTAPDNGNSGASGGAAGLIIAALVLIAVVGMLLKDVLPEVTVAKPQIIKASKR